MACMIGPLALSPCTATVLAHGPVLGPRFRIATRAAPQRLKLAPPAPFCIPGSASPLLHSPAPFYAYLHRLSSGQLSCTPVYAPLCTAAFRARHLSVCAPRLPVARRSAYPASEGWIGARTELPGTGFGKGRFRLSAPYSAPLRRPGCGCSAAGGGGPSVPARQDVRHG